MAEVPWARAEPRYLVLPRGRRRGSFGSLRYVWAPAGWGPKVWRQRHDSCWVALVRSLPLIESTAARGRGLPLAVEVRDADRRARPVYAVWELTLRCDLSCQHCGSRAGRARPDELSRGEALELVEQLAALGVREVTLIGGEAYLHPAYLEVVAAITERDMTCTMTSAGRGITPKLAQAAAQAGLRSVSISLDGAEACHDRLRGLQGAYHAARRALVNLEQAGIPRALNTQVNRENLADLDHVLDVAAEHGCHGWQVFLTVPMGRAADRPELLLQPSDLLTVMPKLESLHADAQRRGIRFLAGNNVGYFGPGERALRRELRDPEQAGCAAGRRILGIEANGDIKGCPSLLTHDWVGGNVRDARLQDIWERSEKLRYTRDRTVADLWGYCRTCYYADECRAGCTWTASSLFGRPGNNPYCHHRAIDFARRGLRERLVPVEPAPGEAFDHGMWQIRVEEFAAGPELAGVAAPVPSQGVRTDVARLLSNQPSSRKERNSS